MKKAKEYCHKILSDKYVFGATVLRWAFGLLFIFVAIKKFRMGYTGFAESLVGGEDLLATEVPNFLLYIYGLILPALELVAGLMLLLNKYSKAAFGLIAVMYLTFIIGQMYNGNTSKIGTEYLPSLAVLAVAFFMHEECEMPKTIAN